MQREDKDSLPCCCGDCYRVLVRSSAATEPALRHPTPIAPAFIDIFSEERELSQNAGFLYADGRILLLTAPAPRARVSSSPLPGGKAGFARLRKDKQTGKFPRPLQKNEELGREAVKGSASLTVS